jgi:hypothetical protein
LLALLSLSPLPLLELLLPNSAYHSAGFLTRHAAGKNFVISRMHMPYVSAHGKFDSLWLKLLGGGGAPDAAGVLLTSMFRNRLLLLHGASRKQFPHAARKRRDVFGIQFPTTFGRTFPRQFTGLRIGEAFLFRSCKPLLFDQNTLSLIAFPRATEADHDRSQGRVASGSPSESGIPTRQKDQMIEVGARQAERPLSL